MATKKQSTAKQKASEIAAQARAAKKPVKANAKPAKEEEVKVAEATKEEKPKAASRANKAAEKAAEEKISERTNTASENEEHRAISAEVAKEFQASSDDNDVFYRRSVNVPGRRALRKAFESEEIVGDELGDIITEGKQKELEYQALSDSAKAKRPKRLLGRVKGVEPIYGPNNKIMSYEAKVSLILNPDDPVTKQLIKEKKEPSSIYSIYIPAPMFFFYRRPEMFEGPDGLKNLLRAMKNKINSIVEFVVYQISADDTRVIGSRVRAMQLKAYEYYLDPQRKKIKEGTKAYARITEVGVSGITVEVCGAECFIHNSELSWLRLNAASDMFKVGQSIPVVVKTIEVGSIDVNGRPTQFVAITASAKEAQKTPIEKYGELFHDNSYYNGVVTYRLANGLYFVRLDDKIDCVCYPPDFGTPSIGANCTVFIKGRNEIGLKGDFTYIEE